MNNVCYLPTLQFWQVCSSNGLLVCTIVCVFVCLSVSSSIQVTVFDICLPSMHLYHVTMPIVFEVKGQIIRSRGQEIGPISKYVRLSVPMFVCPLCQA